MTLTANTRRREFIKIVIGSASAWPLIARAQQFARGKWRIGMLAPTFRQKPILEGLQERGYVEGENLSIEWRFDERADQLFVFANELVGLKPDLIAAYGTQAAQAAQRATKNIPIVIAASNPIGNGLVESLAHPGGNITGMSLQTPELSGKRLELFRQASGNPTSIAVLYDSDDPPALNAIKETAEAAQKLGLQLTTVGMRASDDLAAAFEKIRQARPGGLVILGSPLMSGQSARIAEFAIQMKLPSIYPDPLFARAGGLMSYGPDYNLIIKNLATYIDKIFNGARPADLPVEQPTEFVLVINLKTAKALGLDIPPTLIGLAEEVVE